MASIVFFRISFVSLESRGCGVDRANFPGAVPNDK